MRRIGAIAGIAVLAVTLAACGGADPDPPPTPGVDLSDAEPSAEGNGLWVLPGSDAITVITEAVRVAGPVRYSGSFTELIVPEDPERDPYPGRELEVEYRGSPRAFAASIDAGSLEVDLVTVDGLTYVHGNAAYARSVGVDEVRHGFVCTATGDALLAEWDPLLDPAALVESLLSTSETISVTAPHDDGQTLEVVLGSDAPVGTFTVAAVGPPLPVMFEGGDGSGDGAFTFTAWGEDPAIEPPSNLARDCG